MGELDGKVALVTGGASGLGDAIARRLAQAGAKVAVGDIDVAAGEKVAADIPDGMFVNLDVTAEAPWQEAVAAVMARYGRLDILVNNAGITIVGSIEEASFADWKKTLDIDLSGVFLGCKTAIPEMKKQGGAIVNISSTAGLQAAAFLAAYNAAKAGVTLLTKSVALHCAEKKYGIRCNSVHPGVIRTPILDKVLAQVPDPDAMMAGFVAGHPIGHIGEPNDIAEMVLFLVSDRAKFITGAAMVVDGGATM